MICRDLASVARSLCAIRLGSDAWNKVSENALAFEVRATGLQLCLRLNSDKPRPETNHMTHGR